MRTLAGILIPVALLVSCSKSENSSPKSDNVKLLDEIRVSWSNIRTNGYSYRVSGSSWVGSSWTTQVTVEEDTVVGRRYYRRTETDPVFTYTETVETLGTNPEGAAPIPIEGIFDACLDVIQVDWNPEVDSALNLSFNGRHFSCTFIPDRCADDCTRGPVFYLCPTAQEIRDNDRLLDCDKDFEDVING